MIFTKFQDAFFYYGKIYIIIFVIEIEKVGVSEMEMIASNKMRKLNYEHLHRAC